MLFLWLKAFHIIFVIAWFSGIFYLPRLFVYHAAATDSLSQERFSLMERKLYRGIMTPSMVLAIALGSSLLWLNPGLIQGGWLDAKLTLVAAVVAYHFWCGAILKKFRAGTNTRSHLWFRWFNEAPVLALVAIVILVVVKPF